MRVRAYRFRAYSSKTTARVLKTKLEAACRLYNTLLHAEQEEYKRNRHSMSKNELRQLALHLRKKNPELQILHSQVARQVAERLYQARQRFLDGFANKPKVKKPHRFLSLVYPQGGWRLSNTREVGLGKNKKKRRARLYLSKIGFSTLILHRVFPENRVCQVCKALSFRQNPYNLLCGGGRSRRGAFIGGVGAQESGGRRPGDHKARHTLLWMGASWKTRNRLSAPLKESGCCREHYQGKSFFQKTGLKQRRNLRRSTSTLRILGVTCSLNSGRYLHRSTAS